MAAAFLFGSRLTFHQPDFQQRQAQMMKPLDSFPAPNCRQQNIEHQGGDHNRAKRQAVNTGGYKGMLTRAVVRCQSCVHSLLCCSSPPKIKNTYFSAIVRTRLTGLI